MIVEGEEMRRDEPPSTKRPKLVSLEGEDGVEPVDRKCGEGQTALIKKSILRSTPGPSSGSLGMKWPFVFDVASPVDLTVSTPGSTKRRVDCDGLIAKCRRVRIVEELDKESDQEDVDQDEEVSDIFQTNFGGERMTWVKVDFQRNVDFDNVVTEDFVLSKRTPVCKKFSVEIGHNFIDSSTLNALVDTKNAIGAIGGGFEFEKAARKNIETWLNSNASLGQKYLTNFKKLEKLDAATNWALTKSPEGELFTFGEIHGNSRGFSQYIIHKKGNGNNDDVDVEPAIKGFTLQAPAVPVIKGRIDFIEKSGILFTSARTRSLYEEVTTDKCSLTASLNETTGQLLNIEVTDGYVKTILDGTEKKGVHLLVVDNEEAFQVPELVREVRFQKYIFCQVMIALLAIREGGSLVLKIFEAFTPFTVGLLFILHRCFSHVSFHRLSDAAFSTERFCICMGKRPQSGEVDSWTQFILKIHGPATRLEEMKGQTQRNRSGTRPWGKRRRKRVPQEEWSNGVSELIPARVITSHADFFAVLRGSNVESCKSVVKGISDLVAVDGRSVILEQQIC